MTGAKSVLAFIVCNAAGFIIMLKGNVWAAKRGYLRPSLSDMFAFWEPACHTHEPPVLLEAL